MPKLAPLLKADQLLTPEQVDALIDQHGVLAHAVMLPTMELRVVVHPDYDEDGNVMERRQAKAAFFEVVIRSGKEGEYKTLRQAIRGPHAANAQERMVRQTVVHPSATELDALLKQWPGLAEGLGKALLRMQALAQEGDEK